MKEYISAATLPFERVSPDLIEELLEVYPEGKREGTLLHGERRISFGFHNLDRSDARVPQILSVLKKHGWYPKLDKALPYQPNEFFLSLVRKYTRHDVEQSEYLVLAGAQAVKGYFRLRETGVAKVCAADLHTTRRDIVTVDTVGLVVRDRLRGLLESMNLQYLTFRPIMPLSQALYTTDGEDMVVSWDAVGDIWFELTSQFVLPPLSLNAIEFVDNATFRPITDPENQSPVLREGLYLEPELHFRRADMQILDAFDLASTREHQGRPGVPWYVASQHLYQLFRKHGIRARWVPVRLDE